MTGGRAGQRARGEGTQFGFLAVVLLAVLLAGPLGEWLGTPPPGAPWEHCRIAHDQQALLDRDGDRPLTIRVEGDTARLDGTMTSAVTCQLRALRNAHPEVTRLALGRMTGTFDDDSTMRAALMVRDWGLDTYAVPGGEISSGAVSLFLAGNERRIAPGAIFGVHSWAFNDDGTEGRNLPRQHPEHRIYLDFYERIGVDPDFYWFSLAAAGAPEIHVMTEQELARFGFATGGEVDVRSAVRGPTR